MGKGFGSRASKGAVSSPLSAKLPRQIAIPSFLGIAFLIALIGTSGCGNGDTSATKPGRKTLVRSGARNEESISIDHVVPIKANRQLDEQLFMFRTLEYLHSQIPANLNDREQLARAITSLHQEFERSNQYAQTAAMDKRLISMYENSVEMIEEYSDLLIEIGAIDRDTIRKHAKLSSDSIVDSFQGSFGIGFGAAATGIGALPASIAVGGFAIKKMVDTHLAQSELDEQRIQRIERRTNEFLFARNRLLGRIEALAGVLADEYKWKSSGPLFSLNENESRDLTEAFESKNLSYLRTHYDSLRETRPKDPYAFSGSGAVYQLQALSSIQQGQYETAKVFFELATLEYLWAAEVTPPGRFHDRLRASFFANAASADCESQYLGGQKSQGSISFSNTALQLRPDDPNGRLRRIQSFAFARNGFFDESVEAMTKVGNQFGRDANFHYEMASLLSLANRPDESIDHLRKAWDLGEHDVKKLRRNRDLANVRSKNPEEFSELVRPEWSFSIKYGFVWNDLAFQNKSVFPLTEAVIHVTWTSNSGEETKESHWIGDIGAGDSCTVQSVFDEATKSEEESVRAILVCEENRNLWLERAFDPIGEYDGLATLQKSDKSDVEAVQKIKLIITPDTERSFRVTVQSNQSEILQAGTLMIGDGELAVVEKPETVRGKLFFDNNRRSVYGWLTIDADQDNSRWRILWLDRY